jgi:iron(III) transport system substrate-binding protein
MVDFIRKRRTALALFFALLSCGLVGMPFHGTPTGFGNRAGDALQLIGWHLGPAVVLGASPHKGLEDLYQAAKKEGQAVFWGPTDPQHVGPAIAAFKRQFPGVEVSHFEIQPPEYTQRLIAEAQAGRVPEADLIELGPREIVALQGRGLLRSFDDWQSLFGLPAAHVYAGGVGVTFYDLPHIVAANSKLLPSSEYPKSWDDLLNPKWKGKIIVEQRLQNVGGLGLVKGEEWLLKFAAGLKNQQPIYVQGGTPAFNQLLGGQAPISIGPYLHHVLGAKRKGQPADLIPLSPMLVSPRPTGVLAKARHPNAAKLFAGWLSTPPAQKILEQASSRGSATPGSGTQTEQLLRESGVELIVDNEKIASKRVEFERLMQKAMGITR